MAAPRRRSRPESAIQSDVIGYLRLVLPPGSLVYANPNAARRTVNGRASNACPGLVTGIPDVSARLPPSGIVLDFEIKTEAGRLSDAQEHVIARIQGLGGKVAVVRSIDEVAAVLREWGIGTREAQQQERTHAAHQH